MFITSSFNVLCGYRNVMYSCCGLIFPFGKYRVEIFYFLDTIKNMESLRKFQVVKLIYGS
jgi:hypothetical protein